VELKPFRTERHDAPGAVQSRTLSALTDPSAAAVSDPAAGLGSQPGAPPSPAGPVDTDTPPRLPPGLDAPPAVQGLRFVMRPMSFALGGFRRFGDVWTLRVPTQPAGFVITCHPDHLRSLLTADPGDAPSLTGESPLRPILGPDSILTSTGARHLRQRRLLLPPFHGEAVARYVEAIAEVANREIDRATSAAATMSSRCCSPPVRRRAARSPIRSCATS
jgi:hypothetical protein